jgi:hypothetical protein
MQKSPLNKLWNYFLVYLPVFLLTSLIITVYLSYVFTYLKFLLTANENGNVEDFFLHHTSSLNTAHLKGKILLAFSLISAIMLFISLLRTVIVNPGFFPSPIELEYKLLGLSNQKKGENKFLTKFSDYLLEGPLTSGEKSQLQKTLRKKFANKLKDEPLNIKFTNEEIIENNKRSYMENSNIEETPSCSSNKEIYLDIYKGVDITKMTFCGTCLRLKVERSHHCRQCQKCILKMDHHCPWLANCIGFNNLKSFLLIQFYGIFCCTIVALSYWETIVNYNMDYNTSIRECWFVISVYLLNLGLLSFLLWLCYINWTNLFKGMTVIEHSERQRFPSTKTKNIYDMGPYRNFTNVFGRNPLVWFIPFFHNKNGNGYVFETNNNFYIK